MQADEIARIRSIPLADVLQALGARRDLKDPARNWRIAASRITVTESRFYDHNAAGALHRMRSGRAGGGGAIDLVQYLKDVGFRDALRELQNLPAPPSNPSNRIRAAAPVDQRPSPTPAPDRLARAQWYLTEVRAIPARVVNSALHEGQVFADAKGNVVFRLRDETGREVGYEVRGTQPTPYHSVHGDKGLFITKAGGAPSAAFVESGIEALSYQALKAQGLVISTTGNAIDAPARMARALEGRGYEILAAFNADKAGDHMSISLSESLGHPIGRDRPDAAPGKDWNDQLQRARHPRAPTSSNERILGEPTPAAVLER
ncbi:MAG TPA: DUF3991 and TOPRIM domain-containing protein [Steroidobacteraceae bacterium]